MFAFLARLILFTIAISAVRWVVRFVQRAWMGIQAPRTMNTADRPHAAPTLLQQDPVCGTWVPIDSSLKTIVRGKVLHFCSPECRDRYRA